MPPVPYSAATDAWDESKRRSREALATRCENFMQGAKRLYEGNGSSNVKGDMWFFELFHHLDDCARALRNEACNENNGASL